MSEHINETIETLLALVTKDVSADDALKYTQAALNVAHVYQCVDKD